MNTAHAADAAQTPRLLLFAAGLVVLVSIGRIQEIFGFLQPLRLGMIAYLVNLFLLFLFWNKEELKFKIKILPHAKMIIALTCLSLLSVPFSVWPGGSKSFIQDYYALVLIFFIILLHVMRSEKDIRFIFGSLLLSVFLMTYLAVSGHDSGRMSITAMYDSNDFAFVLVCVIPIIFYMSQVQGPLKKLLSYGFLGLVLVGVVFTGSRGGFVGLAVVLLVIFFKERKHILRNLLLVSVVIFVGFTFADHDYWDRMQSIMDSDDYNYHAEGGRIEVWKRGLGFMFDNPVLGAGIGQYAVADGLSAGDRLGWKWSTAHNSYIQIGAELGIGGLLLFLALLLKSIVVLRKLRRMQAPLESKPFIVAMSNGLEVSIYGYMTTSLFLSHAYSSILYFLLANVVVLHALAVRQEIMLRSRSRDAHEGAEASSSAYAPSAA